MTAVVENLRWFGEASDLLESLIAIKVSLSIFVEPWAR